MKDKYKQAGLLLKSIVNSSSREKPLSVNQIYSMLVNYGISETEQSFDCKKVGFFDYWFYEFRDTVKVNKGYTSLTISNEDDTDLNNFVKVSISLDSSHIRIGVKIIIDYLNSNNIKYISKIDNRISNENVYFLVRDTKTAEDLSSYIKNNSYIQDGLLKSNPFLYNENGIAYSNYTGLSESYVLSKIIKLYLDNGYPKNANNEVELDLFLRFCTDYYNEVFSGSRNIKRFLTDMNEEDSYINSNKLIKYKNVVELIIRSFQTNFSFDHFKFMNRRKAIDNNQNYNVSINDKKKILDLALVKNFEMDIYKRVSEGNRDEVKNLEISALYNMMKNGNFNVIVDENYRDLIKKIFTREDVNRIVQNCLDQYDPIPVEQLSDIEIESYARTYIENMYQNNKSI